MYSEEPFFFIWTRLRRACPVHGTDSLCIRTILHFLLLNNVVMTAPRQELSVQCSCYALPPNANGNYYSVCLFICLHLLISCHFSHRSIKLAYVLVAGNWPQRLWSGLSVDNSINVVIFVIMVVFNQRHDSKTQDFPTFNFDPVDATLTLNPDLIHCSLRKDSKSQYCGLTLAPHGLSLRIKAIQCYWEKLQSFCVFWRIKLMEILRTKRQRKQED